MSGFLLDTNVISELTRAKPNQRVAEWLEAVDEALLYFSVLTLGEIRKGVAMLAPSPRRTLLEAWLGTELVTRFAGRVLPIDGIIADRWGLLAGQAQAKGTPLAVIDGLLAATALHHNLSIVTRNARDFAGTGVAVFNPWEE